VGRGIHIYTWASKYHLVIYILAFFLVFLSAAAVLGCQTEMQEPCLLSFVQAERLAARKARVVRCICMGHTSMVAMVLSEHRCVWFVLSRATVNFHYFADVPSFLLNPAHFFLKQTLAGILMHSCCG